MTYSLKAFFLQLFLVSTAFGLVFTYGEHRLGMYVFIAVSALYSSSFALFFGRSAALRNGISGAVLGWALAFLFNVVPDFFRYMISGGVEPTFDGDGPWMGLAILPLLAFLYLLIPIVIMGSFIGWISFGIRSLVSSQDASATCSQ